MKLKIYLLAFLVAHIACQVVKAQENTTDQERFAFILEKSSKNDIALESIYNTAWTYLSSNVLMGSSRFVYYHGINNKNLPDWKDGPFIVEIETKKELIVFKSVRGTYWDEVAFNCTETKCRFLITDQRVIEIGDISPNEKNELKKAYEFELNGFSTTAFEDKRTQLGTDKRIEELKKERAEVEKIEKNKLKEALKRINENEIISRNYTEKQIDSLKLDLATKTTLDIENQLAIIDNQIAYLERNPSLPNEQQKEKEEASIKVFNREVFSVKTNRDKTEDNWEDRLERSIEDLEDKLERSAERFERNIEKSGERFERNIEKSAERFEKNIEKSSNTEVRRRMYYPRTDDYLVVAIAFNNALPDGGSLQDTGIRFAGSRTFEIGYSAETRVFRNTNFLRLKYGVSFQFNGLKPEGNRIFVTEGDQTLIQEVEVNLRKNKFRMDNLILPVHLQFGSNGRSYNGYRSMSEHDFKVGIGGFVGLNLRNVQKLRYTDLDGKRVRERQRNDFNTNNLLYGLSAYVGWDSFSIFAQYNLNPIFRNNPIDVNNFQIGVRFDIN
jgi:hypothetical protein